MPGSFSYSPQNSHRPAHYRACQTKQNHYHSEMNRFLHTLTGAAIVAMTFLASACSMMTDDVEDCPAGLYVRYVYDYNTMRADMFKDHVGHVTLYIYDEDGRKVAERSVSNIAQDSPLATYGYTMHFDPGELAPGRYRLQAIGLQNDWEASQSTDRAKYQRTTGHTEAQAFNITLEHPEQPHPETGRHHVDHRSLPLDTLWHTLKVMSYEPVNGRAVPDMHRTSAPYSVYPMEEQYVTVAPDRATYATVSLIRDTKHLNITLRQIDDPADMQHSRYEVTIDDDNSLLAHDNSIVPNHPLRYTPFAGWTTKFSSNGLEYESGDLAQATAAGARLPSRADGDDDDPATGAEADVQRTAHFNVMYNRIMHSTDDSQAATLRIRNKETGVDVATINLPTILAQGRTAYEYYNYSPQEYLDREHDYHLDFLLKGDKWEYIDVRIDILSWSVRIENYDLE